MQALLARLLMALVLAVAAECGAAWGCACDGADAGGGACGKACGGDETQTSDEAEGATPEATDAGVEPDAGSTEEPAKAGGAAEATEAPGEPACMLDVFRRLDVGDWVRTRWTNKEIHTLLVAGRTDELITIEEIVEDRGFRKAWTQLDVSLADGSLRGLRERLADGTIQEREPSAESQRGTSDLLLEPFRPDGNDEIEIRKIEVYADGEKQGDKRGLFLCRRYRITVEKNRYAHLWFSRIKLPNYPVKIHYYEENLTIQLDAFGTGRVSEFTKQPERRLRQRHDGSDTESQ